MVVYSMFDGSGIMVKPWADAGHTCFCFNASEADHGLYSGVRVEHTNIHYIDCWIVPGFHGKGIKYPGGEVPAPDIVFAFPPCTDLTNAGSRHWASKEERHPGFQNEAVEVCKAAFFTAHAFGVPYMIENPVGKLSTMWRKPDAIIQPHQFGGYLSEDDIHPNFPDIIPARDAYRKTTCLWYGGGFVLPEIMSVNPAEKDNPGWKKLGGKSAKTKLIRSLTPRGFATAVYIANAPF